MILLGETSRSGLLGESRGLIQRLTVLGLAGKERLIKGKWVNSLPELRRTLRLSHLLILLLWSRAEFGDPTHDDQGCTKRYA